MDDNAILSPGLTLGQELAVELGKHVPYYQGSILCHRPGIHADLPEPHAVVDIRHPMCYPCISDRTIFH